MKNQIKKSQLIILSFLFFTSINVYSQFVQPPSTNEVAAGLTTNIGVINTGNDILKDGSDRFRVSVWSETGSLSGISWIVDYTGGPYTGDLAFASGTPDIIHADVSLIKDPGDNSIHAIVGWYYAGNMINPSWYLEDYMWVGNPTYAFVLQTNTFINGSFGTALNVDADDNGNFVMVYDEGGSIYAWAGFMSSGFNIHANVDPLYLTAGTYPDVALYYDGAGSEQMHLTFISGGDLYAQNDDFSNIIGASVGLGNSISPISPTFGDFSHPRIACPNSTTGLDVESWTVVWQEDDRFTYFIHGVNEYRNSTNGPYIYNDGTIINNGGAIDLQDVENYWPVVAYDNQDPPTVWIGWNLNNGSGFYNYTGIVDAIYPIALKCDEEAYPISTTDYWQVPDALSNDEYVYPLSLASRYAVDEIFFTYYNINASLDIYTKTLPSVATTTSLRQIDDALNLEHKSKSLSTLSPLANYSFNLYDVNGRKVAQERGTPIKMKNKLNNCDKNLPNGIYFIQVISDDSKFFLSQKVQLGN